MSDLPTIREDYRLDKDLNEDTGSETSLTAHCGGTPRSIDEFVVDQREYDTAASRERDPLDYELKCEECGAKREMYTLWVSKLECPKSKQNRLLCEECLERAVKSEKHINREDEVPLQQIDLKRIFGANTGDLQEIYYNAQERIKMLQDEQLAICLTISEGCSEAPSSSSCSSTHSQHDQQQSEINSQWNMDRLVFANNEHLVSIGIPIGTKGTIVKVNHDGSLYVSFQNGLEANVNPLWVVKTITNLTLKESQGSIQESKQHYELSLNDSSLLEKDLEDENGFLEIEEQLSDSWKVEDSNWEVVEPSVCISTCQHGEFQISIKTSMDGVFAFKAKAHDTIDSIKARTQDREGFCPDLQQFEDGFLLSDYCHNIPDLPACQQEGVDHQLVKTVFEPREWNDMLTQEIMGCQCSNGESLMFPKVFDKMANYRYDQLYDETVFKCSYCNTFQKALTCIDCITDGFEDAVKLVVGGWSLAVGKYTLRKHHLGYWKCFKHAAETSEDDGKRLYDPNDYQCFAKQ